MIEGFSRKLYFNGKHLPPAFLVSLLLLGLLYPFKGVGVTNQAQALEGRGIWVHPYYFSSDPEKGASEIKGNFTLYKSLNLNFILYLVKDPYSWVYYNSSINPVNPSYLWDPLNIAIKEARALGLELHAWFCVFPEGDTETQDHGLLWERPDLAMIDFDGKPVAWACPAKKDVRSYEMSLILEVATKYDVDGIHLDYIRYPNSKVCYCDYCRLEFGREYGFNPKTKPDDPLWINWKCAQISSFVNETYTRVKQIKPHLKVSAAVFYNLQSAISGVHQNWKNWADGGHIDFLTPMVYIPSVTDFQNSIDNIMRTTEWKVPVYAGIGLYRLPNAGVLLDQIDITRMWGTQGQVLFCCHYLKEDYIEALRDDPYSEPTLPPHRDAEAQKMALAQGQARYEITILTLEKMRRELDNMQRTLSLTQVWALITTCCAVVCALWLISNRRERDIQ